MTIFTMNKHISPHLVEQVDKNTFDYTDVMNGKGEQHDDKKLDEGNHDDDDDGDDDDTNEEEEE